MKINTLIKYLFNRKAIKDPKPINSTTIKYFIQGHLRSFGKNFGITEDYILEQASEREKRVKAINPKCFELGECEYCECSLNESLLSEGGCKHGCYGKMLKKDDWNNFKK